MRRSGECFVVLLSESFHSQTINDIREQQQKHQNVLIMGGGLAWLPAAVTLLERNRDFQLTLLEAKDRLGGRLHTVSPDTRQAPFAPSIHLVFRRVQRKEVCASSQCQTFQMLSFSQSFWTCYERHGIR